MPAFMQKSNATQQTPSAGRTKPVGATLRQGSETNSILHLQRTIGNQALQQQIAMPVGIRGSVVSASRNVLSSAMSTRVLQRQVNDPRKLEIERIDTPRRVRVSEWLVESRPGGGTERTELYWADFEVDAKGCHDSQRPNCLS